MSPPSRSPDVSSPFDRDVIALFGLPFDLGGAEVVAERVMAAVRVRERLFLSTVNLDWLVQAGRDPAFRASALASDHVTMDGVPVVRLAQLAGVPEAEKAAGSDLFERLRAEPLSVFFFGGRPGAARAAHQALAASGGPMRAAGHHDPGHGDVASMSTPEHLAPIEASGADLLVVALGAKKGQAWLMANHGRVSPPVVTHLGAVVDFTAGTVARAPRLMQTTGLEWAWRIGQDRALWRRYADDAGALPTLTATAARVRREIARSRAEAGAGRVDVQDDAEGTVLTLSGAVASGPVREALKAAPQDRALRVRLADGAAPDLRALGQLTLARQAWGDRYALCTREARTARLIGWTMGERPGL